MDNEFKEYLKDAICHNDVNFLVTNRRKYDINERFKDEDNDTLLLYAISDKNSEAYRFFLENGADTKCVNNEGEGILHAIVFSGVINRLLDFMNNYLCDINACTVENVTPLLLSISLEKIEMAKIFINKGADVNIGDIDRMTPLHLAVQLNNFELVECLINHGANLCVKTQKGNYPLALAVNRGNDNLVKYLFNRIYGSASDLESGDKIIKPDSQFKKNKQQSKSETVK